MRSQKRLRDELRFITEFNTLCDVIQQVAVSQLQRADEQLGSQPNLSELLAREFFPLLPPSAREAPFARSGRQGRLLVVLTSDEGMVGPLHANVVRHALGYAEPTARWILIGQRGLRLLGEQAASARVMPIPGEDQVEAQMRRLSQVLLRQFTEEALRDVWLVAPRFVSTTRQDVVAQQLLPLPARWAATPDGADALLIEPSVALVVEQLAARWVECVCVESFWSARRAEFAARALQMESSRQELAKQHLKLRYAFFKTLHERVDVMVRETGVVQRLSEARTTASPRSRERR